MKKRKAMKRLEARRRDYDLMVARTGFKAPQGADHRPGSNNK